MKIHFVTHESFESPAVIEDWVLSRKHEATYTRVFEGDQFPENCDFDCLIVMGGPQSPTTTLEECPHFDAAKELGFIKKAIARTSWSSECALERR